MLEKWSRWLLGGVMILLWTNTAAPRPQKETVDFEKQIRPIFQQACYKCHGPNMAMGELRLDDKGLALKGGISGPAILPGKSGESRLVHRILGEGGDARMPFGGSPLTADQITAV